MSLNHLLAGSKNPKIDVDVKSLKSSQRSVAHHADGVKLKETDSGRTLFVSQADGAYNVDLPNPNASRAGIKYNLVLSERANNNVTLRVMTDGDPNANPPVAPVPVNDKFVGHILRTIANDNDGITRVEVDDANTLQFVANSCMLGDKIELVYSDNKIYVSAIGGTHNGLVVP